MVDRGSYYEKDRLLDNPAVQAVIKASDRVLPESERGSLSFRPVGGAIVIHGMYQGLQPKTSESGYSSEGILLGVVSAEGVPYSAFTQLRRDPVELEKEVEQVSQWAKGELRKMGSTLKRTLPSIPSLRKIITTVAMRRENPG